MLEEVEGALAVRLAREALAAAVGASGPASSTVDPPPVFRNPSGVFVSWYRYPGHELRGCVGLPEPVLPLLEALREAAVAAGLEDPRFPPVGPAELPHLAAEVSVLGEYADVPLSGRPKEIVPGRDGLIAERGRRRGLLLPQVAPEQGWSAEEFLDGVCEKAGLPPSAWRSEETGIRRFRAEVFRETSPAGPVVRWPAAPAKGASREPERRGA